MKKATISPATKVVYLLNEFSEFENELLKLMPELGNLKNPSIREAVKDSLTLETISQLQQSSLPDLIRDVNLLINGTGADEIEITPDWFNENNIVNSIDARPLLARGEHPVQLMMMETQKLNKGEILEMITPFKPTPLLDMISQNGFEVFSLKINESLFKNYFMK